MKLMKTAEEMCRYCMEQGTYDTASRRLLKHFQVIEDCMAEDEYALVCFAGMNEQIYLDGINSSASIAPTTHTELACAFTNQRVIAGQGYWYPSILKVAPYGRLNDVYTSTCREGTNIVISTENEEIAIHTSSGRGENIRRLLDEILPEIKRKKAAKSNGNSSGVSPADEIRKFKGLLDDGIITEEEFRKKKEQLLDVGDALEQLTMGTDIVVDIKPADYNSVAYAVEDQNGEKGTLAEIRNGTVGVGNSNGLKDVGTKKECIPEQKSWVLTGILSVAFLIVVAYGIYMIYFVEV